MIASLSARLIAEEWLVGPGAPGLDGIGLELDWFHRLADDRPLVYARLVPKVARLVAAARAADQDDRLAYIHALEIVRETLGRL